MDILWHGRGGDGAFTAARLLGAAYSLKDASRHALAFPSFGPERRGAPIRAFTKLDTRPILARNEIKLADFIIFLDDTLFSEAVFDGLRAGGLVILNTAKKYTGDRVAAVDACKIAVTGLRLPAANTAMLGALAALWDGVTVADIERGVNALMAERLRASNVAAVRATYDATRGAAR
jgi:pyruvate ferredoxin oxidoreductase gamma subunit